jgi:uncharacterized DUF497 family protein
VDFTFDPAKNARNIDVHGISFDRVVSLGKANKREVRRYARQIQTKEDISGSRQP